MMTGVFADIIDARINKGNIYCQTGDFQKAVEELSLGLKNASEIKDTSVILQLLNERAAAYAKMKSFDRAFSDAAKALSLIKKNDYEALANNFKVRAFMSEDENAYDEALSFHKRVIFLRFKTANAAALAKDYLDAGNSAQAKEIAGKEIEPLKARDYYTQSLMFAQKASDYVIAAKASNNLGLMSLLNTHYATALSQYHSSLVQTIPSFKNNDPIINPTYIQCNAISDKNFLSVILGNKTECLLYLYKQTNNKQYLSAAIKTARLTDSVITDMRHEQTGEQSKLYWRNNTRRFFTNAIEAAYLAKDAQLAFFFMEKSRAVLLNDKLNELGASAYLPPEEAPKEQAMQINVLALQQQLAQLDDADPAYEEQQVKLLQAKEDLDNYIKTLQDKYSAYYQYKYADDVPELNALQKYLSKNKQSFVHYFISDTTIYMLGITASSSKLIKLKQATI
jgi:hypothetical protein